MKQPYLIQRAKIVKPLASVNERLSNAVEFDYMGSAEFEFGALPKSLHRIETVVDSWKCRVVNEIKEEDSPLRVYSALTDEEFEQYKSWLIELRKPNNTFYLKEMTYFEEGYDQGKYFVTDFWWDIENDVMFGFNKNFMNRLPEYVSNSLVYMNEKKAK